MGRGISGRQEGETELNPLLFNILILDIEEEMRKVKWGGGVR